MSDEPIKAAKVFEHQPQQEVTLKAASHFDNDELLDDSSIEAIVAEVEQPIASLKPQKRKWSLLAKLSLLSVMSLIFVELFLSLYGAWQQSGLLFGFYATVVTIVVSWASTIAMKEWRQLKQLKQVEDNQLISQRLSQSMQMGEAEPFIDALLQRQAVDNRMAYAQNVREEHNDAERIMLFERTVIEPCDLVAKKLVHKYATESALLLAASPVAMLDMAIILWRNQTMIYDIARSYGITLGYWSRIKLIRAVIVNIIYAGTSEIVTDIGTQLLSVEMTGKLSARLAQGMGGGILTARLGYQAMALCRPVAFSEAKRPKLTQIHRELLSELRDFSAAVLNKSSERNKDFTNS
ncbi:TIGR01620 family protein [Shewanella sp. Scap07]|uniref:YcjF family protein n=1 Tax=Shewanella sp. Scap07 TaxID=2589987 RepID=UPI0015BBD07E|nr:TIGR01620 family protein [Shewanella sp. Scap07]QLE84992.1 TIGR01620 family protein [Shewanella sp. Scap07]